MILLGIETSCDETSAAVLDSGPAGRSCRPMSAGVGDAGTWGRRAADPEISALGAPGALIRLLSNVVSSQIDLHARFGGVVPEISARAHLERLPAVVSEAFLSSGKQMGDIDAIAVTNRPGLLTALLCGLAYARGLSLALDRPLYAVDHVKAHVAAAFLEVPPNPALTTEDLPAIALVASGGHTLLLKMTDPVSFELLGTTRDDAVGEAFDKVGQMLDLPFPGGPHVERASFGGDPKAFRFPIGVIRGAPLDFSFSGVKTSVLYTLAKMTSRERRKRLADLAASFQAAAVRALVDRSLTALELTGIKTFVLCGGVAANRTLQEALSVSLAASGVKFHVPPFIFCGDTAAQVAAFGAHLAASGAAPAGVEVDALTTSEVFESGSGRRPPPAPHVPMSPTSAVVPG